MRTRLLALCGALVLPAVVPGPARGQVEGGPPEWFDPDRHQELFLEIDEIEPTDTKLRPARLKHWFEPANIIVTGELERTKLDDPNLDPNVPCVYIADIDNLLQKTRTQSPPGDAWYVHGLVVPWVGVYEYDVDTGGPTCEGNNGMLWFAGDEVGQRESFVLFDGTISDSGDASTSMGMDGITATADTGLVAEEDEPLVARPVDPGHDALRAERNFTAAHDLLHVLNAHHCEFGSDGWAGPDRNIGHAIKTHLMHWQTDPDHVRPGGSAWCDLTREIDHRADLHAPAGCSEVCEEPEGLNFVDISVEGLELQLEPEKSRYLPGEPIAVNVGLRYTPPPATREQPVRGICYVEHSMNETATQLAFQVGQTPRFLRPLRMPILAHGKPKPRKQLPPGESLHREGVGIWYGLHPKWSAWNPDDPQDKHLWVKVSFVVYTPVDESTDSPLKPCSPQRQFGAVRVVSSTVRIVIGVDPQQPELFSTEAHRIFVRPENRKMLWMQGGRHLAGAMADMNEISARFGPTTYSAYADAVLGAGLSRPTLEFKGPRKKRVTVRPGEFNRALIYLNRARERRDELPPSFRRPVERQWRKAEQGVRGGGRPRPPRPPR